jgi:glycosyltransferase involved in cell wall biosynthesis
MGRQTQKIVELPYPIDTERFSPGAPDPGLAARTAGPGPLLLFVAALDRAHYHKGLGALLAALADPAVPIARLMVVGDGGERLRYEAEARQLGLVARVHFLGRQSQAGLVNALRTCDALILPSETQSEAFGMVVLEAMACAKPAIISDLPGLRSLPPPEGATLRIQPPLTAGQLARCLNALAPPAVRSRLGEAGRTKAVARHDSGVVGDHLEALYQTTARGRPEAVFPKRPA